MIKLYKANMCCADAFADGTMQAVHKLTAGMHEVV